MVYVARLSCEKTLHGEDFLRTDVVRGYPDWPEFEECLTVLGKTLLDHMRSVFPDEDCDELADRLDYIATSSWDAMESNWMKDWMRSQGYDSCIVTGDGVDAIAVFSPDQIEIFDKVVASHGVGSGLPQFSGYRKLEWYDEHDITEEPPGLAI